MFLVITGKLIFHKSTCVHSVGEFSFLGTRILDKVFDDLLLRGLYNSKHLLIAGSRYKT